MKYAVIWTSDFEEGIKDTDNFWYEAEDTHSISYTEANNKIEAAVRFLSKEYDEIDFADTFWAQDIYNYMMKSFISYSVCGDKLLEQCERQDEINNLINDIYDYYIESLMKDGKVKIQVYNGEITYTIPGNDEFYIAKVNRKFSSNRLINLLTEDEKKELYIQISLAELMVIPLVQF